MHLEATLQFDDAAQSRRRWHAQKQSRGFTLIELILVLALLVISISLITPKLSGFFAGRDLDSETHRLLSLTRYGQDRAVSEGIPMILWIDTQSGTYGLEQETGYMKGSDTKAVDYKVADGLKIAIDRGTSKPPTAGKSYGIHFSPDGNVVTATSVHRISLQDGNHPAVWIAPSFNGLTYELQGDRNQSNARR